MTSFAKVILVVKSKERLRQKQLQDLRYYLNVPEKLEDDLIAVDEARMNGTCEWLLEKENYLKWSGSLPKSPNILWVCGKPAAGKSVLAGHVISRLKERSADCSYFFFKRGDRSKSGFSACLRALAFQMACTNINIQETFLQMMDDGIKIENDNVRALWHKLFQSGIFQMHLPRHYWIVDALDECINLALFFDSVLAKFDGTIPIQILITSRSTPELERHFKALNTQQILYERISTSDTLPDIELLVEAKAKTILVKDDKDRASLVKRILGKSEGSFLWTVLVLNKLSSSYGEEEMNRAIENMPCDMEPLYKRTLESMSQATGGRNLTKAILTWATCAIRPLKTNELEEALRIDVKDNFPKLEECILALCGNLVTVDKFGRVQMLHETAREFLVNDQLDSEFAINKKQAHTRIARACLTYLTGNEMRPPRTGRRSTTQNTKGKRAQFSIYACSAFSYHLANADPLASDVWSLVNKFLESNVLSWIEVVAQTQNLIPLIRAAKNLKKYLHSCAAEMSPLGRSMQTIRGWTTDFVRIVAKFSDALTTSPSSIYSLIIPLCPTESSIYRIAKPAQRMSVVGVSNASWDDRLSCIDFREGQTSAVCYGDDFLAVGLTTGTVALYHAGSYQEYKTLNHGEAVKILQHKDKTCLLASCGAKIIRLWDIYNGQEIHTFRPQSRVMSLAFDQNLLMATSVMNFLSSWDLDDDGNQKPDRPWIDSGRPTDTPLRGTPCAVSIGVGHQMLAIAYSGRPIMIWDLEEDQCYGSCGQKMANGETSTHLVTALVFNPNPDIGLLAASYLDGELALLDPIHDRQLESFRANCHTLTASPDGRLLAGGAEAGTINIYEFDTLRLLYRVKSSNLYIKQLAFNKDSSHLSDVRGSHCNVWEPPIQFRELVSDDTSDGSSSSIVDVIASGSTIKVSAIVLHPKEDVVFCGKSDGSVSLYDLKTGIELRRLYCHKSMIRHLTWWAQGNNIMSTDVANGINAWNLTESPQGGWITAKSLFQSRLDCGEAIVQILAGETAGKFILSTRKSDHLWCIAGQQENARIHSSTPGIRRWVQHQQSPLHMICFEGTVAKVYSWTDWSEVASVSIAANVMGRQLKSVVPIAHKADRQDRMLLEFSELGGSPNTRSLCLLDSLFFGVDNLRTIEVHSKSTRTADDTGNTSAISNRISVPFFGPQLTALAQRVAHVVDFSDANGLIFLDTQSWVCSVDLKILDSEIVAYKRHFFVPYDWFAGTRDVICTVARRDVIFARNDSVAIVKGGLEYAEKLAVEVDSVVGALSP